MGRKKMDCSDSKIIENTLLGTYYEGMNVVDCLINSTYYQKVEEGHRLKMIKNGRVTLEFIIRNFGLVRIKLWIKSDLRYERDRCDGYVDRMEILEEDGMTTKEEVSGYYIRQMIVPMTDGTVNSLR